MIAMPFDWETAQGFTGEGRSLPAGAYICKIVNANPDKSKKGVDMLAIAFDIADGEYCDIYCDMYNRLKKENAEAKWPNSGTYRQLIANMDGTTNGFFKGMILNIQASNPGYEWNWDEKSLKGKLFGGVFRREEYLDNEQKARWTTRLFKILPVDGIENVKPPEDKPLDKAVHTTDGWVSDEQIPF